MRSYVNSLSNTPGTIQPWQLSFLMGITAMLQDTGTHVLEFGTLDGNTATNLARMLPRHKILTCSLPPNTQTALKMNQNECAQYAGVSPTFPDDVSNRITHYACDSALLRLPADVKLGFVFIDGAHSRDYVLNDFSIAEPRVVVGGVVVFHDYGNDMKDGITEVKEAVDEIATRHPDWIWTQWKGGQLVWGRKP